MDFIQNIIDNFIDALMENIQKIIDVIFSAPDQSFDIAHSVGVFAKFFHNLADRFEKIGNVFSYMLNDEAQSIFMSVIYIWAFLMLLKFAKSVISFSTGGAKL